jgi:Flp pilus assembly protein TadG
MRRRLHRGTPASRAQERHGLQRAVGAFRPRSRGQALVEFALVLPVMMLVLLIVVDFGRLFFAYISDVNAAREGASYAAMHAADSPYDATTYYTGVQQAALAQANAQGQGGGGTLAVASPACFSPSAPSNPIGCNVAAQFAGGSGDQVTVTVSQPFSFLTPLINNFFGGSLTLTASATAPVLNPLVATTVTTTSTSTTSTSTSSTSTSTTSTTTSTSSTQCVAPVVTVSPASTRGGNKQTQITVAFTATVTNGPGSAWQWDFGDGTKSSSQTSSSGPHTYTYTLPVNNGGNGQDDQTWTLKVEVTTTPGCTGSGQATVTLHP